MCCSKRPMQCMICLCLIVQQYYVLSKCPLPYHHTYTFRWLVHIHVQVHVHVTCACTCKCPPLRTFLYFWPVNSKHPWALTLDNTIRHAQSTCIATAGIVRFQKWMIIDHPLLDDYCTLCNYHPKMDDYRPSIIRWLLYIVQLSSKNGCFLCFLYYIERAWA